jgi:hypothetical protein
VKRSVDKRLVEKRLVEKRLVEKRLVEKRLVEKRLVEKRLVERPLVLDLLFEEVMQNEQEMMRDSFHDPVMHELKTAFPWAMKQSWECYELSGHLY